MSLDIEESEKFSTVHLDVPATNGILTPDSVPSPSSISGCDHDVTGVRDSSDDDDIKQQQHIVYVHINPGETFTVQVGDQYQHIQGPATVRMISNSGPPMPMPMHVPPGHMVQQIVDENGILTHVILSAQPPPLNSAGTANPNQQQQQPTSVASGYYNGTGSTTGTVLPHLAHFAPINFGQHANAGSMPLHFQPCINPNNNINHTEDRGTKHRHTNRRMNNRTDQNRLQNRNSNAMSKRVNNINGDKKPNISKETSSSDEEIEIGDPLKDPVVENLTRNTVTIFLEYPTQINPANNPVDYELQLLKPNENKYETVYTGDATEITLQDLRPGTDYGVRICALQPDIETNIKPAPSATVNFHTKADTPEAPTGLKLTNRQKSSVTLKWVSPSHDNGSKISLFVLEQQSNIDHQAGSWIELYRGAQKMYKVTKLQPNCEYCFRVAAINGEGIGKYSDILRVLMSGAPPTQPQPPICILADITFIKLRWERRPSDESFTIQMEDSQSGHGYLPVYCGSDLQCTVQPLRRNTMYKFRLAATNEDGQSRWSDTISISTKANTPGSPAVPVLKSKPHPHHARIVWDEPKDTGGSEILCYSLEMGDNRWVYEGTDNDFTIENLQPGGNYRCRVLAKNISGYGTPSNWLSFNTTCVAPSRLPAPKFIGKPRADSFQIEWPEPIDNGGSKIDKYFVQMTLPNSGVQQVYVGLDRECSVVGLQPGKIYLLQVRSMNEAGLASPWSPIFEAQSGPGVPESPSELQSIVKSPIHAHLKWQEPANNGAVINEYKLEWRSLSLSSNLSETTTLPYSSTRASSVSSSDADLIDSSNVNNVTEQQQQQQLSNVDVEELNRSKFIIVNGAQTSFDLKQLAPATNYEFKVQASNVAGYGFWSDWCKFQTTPSSPACVQHVRLTCDATSVQVEWRRPVCNGSPITHYQLDVGEKHLINVPELSTAIGRNINYLVDNLQPETTYRLRVQAVNLIGEGAFSTPVRFTTRPLPPIPPKIDCLMTTPNSLRLKWGDKNTEQIKYALEMLKDTGSTVRSRNNHSADKSYHVIYYGTAQQHKISRLSETSCYHFRIRASNDAGDGPYSENFTFRTSKASPPAVKAPRILRLTNDTATIEWTPVRAMGRDVLHYIVQMANKDSPLHDVYRGPDTQYVLTRLPTKSNHEVRVCCVRISTEDGKELQGAFSPLVDFIPCNTIRPISSSSSTMAATGGGGGNSTHMNGGGSGRLAWRSWRLSEQQWAFILLVAFGAVAVLLAIGSQQIMSIYGASPTTTIGDTTTTSSSSSSAAAAASPLGPKIQAVDENGQ